jgi:hypothetical protein
MINYSIPKPHPLVGHFIQINSQAEYDRMKELVRGCGFNHVETYASHKHFCFKNNLNVRCYNIGMMSGQQITLDELEELVKLSKIELPQVMEVGDNGSRWYERTIVDFYKGTPVWKHEGNYLTYKNFRPLNPHQSEIEKLETEIKLAQAKIETLKNAK